MMPFLLHGRILGGGGPPPPGIVDPPGWTGVEFSSLSYSLSGTANAIASFTIKSDGTWETLSDGPSIGGNWITPGSTGIGASYKVRMTVTSSFGSGTGITVINDAVAVSSLSVNRQFSVEATRSTNGTRFVSRTVLVEIFSASDVLLSSASFTVSATAEVGS